MRTLRLHRALKTGMTVALCAASLALTQTGMAQAAQKVRIDIPAQDLSAALTQFGRETGTEIVFAPDAVREKKAGAVKGEFERGQALQMLLEGSGLTYRVTAQGAIIVEPSQTSTQVTDTGSVALAQTDSPQNRNNQAETFRSNGNSEQTASRAEGRTQEVLEQVTVTGSHIRGAAPTGSPLQIIDRDEIFRSGFTTVSEVMRALPQNFSGGAQEVTIGGTPGNAGNTSSASSINLRGLGQGATLVLVNGRRMAPSGFYADFVDVGSIPATAIDRIEVLTDGASAIYGSDAIAGVVNIKLRQDYEGAETSVQTSVPTQGGAYGTRIGQILGTRWDGGNAFLSYEYYQRDDLPARDRRLTASSDLRRFGGSDFRNPNGNPGTIVIGAQTWAIPFGQDGRSLTVDDLVEGTSNPYDRNEPLKILPEQTRNSVLGVVDHTINDRNKIFADLLFSQRDVSATATGLGIGVRVPSSNPFYVNPTGDTTPITVRYNFIDDLGPVTTDVDVTTYSGSVGVEHTLGRDWKIMLRGGYGREEIDQQQHNRFDFSALNAALARSDPATAFNPFGDGSFTSPATLAEIRSSSLYESTSAVTTGTITATGPVLSVPAGDIKLALGGDFQRQTFDTHLVGSSISDRSYEREIHAAFGEVLIPIVAAGNARPGVQSLDVSLAARYEDYSDFGSTTTPKIGVAWSPSRSVALRGTWGRSFKAPTLPMLSEVSNFTFLDTTPNAPPASGFATILNWGGGGNADLTEERATTWTVGVDLTPARAESLRVGVTYFEIDFTDRIQEPSFGQYLVDPAFADLVTFNPTLEQRAEACGRSEYFGTDMDECLNAPIAALVDTRVRNTAVTNQRGVDFDASYVLDTDAGQFNLGLNGTYLLELEQAQLRTSAPQDILNTPLNPIDLRFRASLGWHRGGLGLSAYVNYIDDYQDIVSVPSRGVASWTTVDAQARYEFDSDRAGWLSKLAIAVGAQNIFDQEAPFFNNSEGVGYDGTNANVIGRVVYAQLQATW